MSWQNGKHAARVTKERWLEDAPSGPNVPKTKASPGALLRTPYGVLLRRIITAADRVSTISGPANHARSVLELSFVPPHACPTAILKTRSLVRKSQYSVRPQGRWRWSESAGRAALTRSPYDYRLRYLRYLPKLLPPTLVHGPQSEFATKETKGVKKRSKKIIFKARTSRTLSRLFSYKHVLSPLQSTEYNPDKLLTLACAR
ncbi:hypothetical protein VTN96DRAFT_3066 [Rasamsonia emersonii]